MTPLPAHCPLLPPRSAQEGGGGGGGRAHHHHHHPAGGGGGGGRAIIIIIIQQEEEEEEEEPSSSSSSRRRRRKRRRKSPSSSSSSSRRRRRKSPSSSSSSSRRRRRRRRRKSPSSSSSSSRRRRRNWEAQQQLQTRTSSRTREAQSRSVMLHHQDQPLNSAFGGSNGSSSSLRNRKADKDGNFNFLPGKDDDGFTGTGGGDENRNQVRPRSLGPLGRDPPSSSPSSGYHHNSGLLSPRSRLPCWSPLEPLPEIESGDDGYGRVPPDGAEERRMEEEEGRAMMGHGEEKLREKKEQQRRRSFKGRQQDDVVLEDNDEWGDSDSESEFSFRSGGSMSDLNMESGGEGMLMGGWDRIGVGEPKSIQQDGDPNSNIDPRRRSLSRRCLPRSSLGDVLEEEDDDDRSSDSDEELPELMDAVWTLRDRERFKAQEMEKHQVQLTMYRRLALIRWVRTLQGRIQEQQNRLQSSFDVILTHRKELLRMGAAAAMSNAAAAATVQS